MWERDAVTPTTGQECHPGASSHLSPINGVLIQLGNERHGAGE